MARSDEKTSRVVGKRIDQVTLPRGAMISAIVRGGVASMGDSAAVRPRRVIMPHHDTVIERDDHIIVFVPRKRQVREVEKLFRVDATFLF